MILTNIIYMSTVTTTGVVRLFCAMPAQHLEASEQIQEDIRPWEIDVTSKYPRGHLSVASLVRTDTTVGHRQKGREFMHYGVYHDQSNK